MSQARILDLRATEPYEYFLELRQKSYAARRVRGREQLSQPYRFEIDYRTKKGELPDPEEFVGNEALLSIERAGVRARYLFAIVTEAWLEGTAAGEPELVIVLEPRLSALKHRTDCRVFRDKTVPQIVSEILHENGVGTIHRLQDSYKVRPYTVMYSESVYDFVHRLLEEEGIFYTFAEWTDPDERPEDSKLSHGIILGDGPHAYEPIEGSPTIQWRATGALSRSEESVFDVSRSARMRPGKVSLRDWNLEAPSAPMDVSADLPRYDQDTIHGPELYSYPGKYENAGEGQRFAKLIADAHAAESQRIRGSSDTARLVCGRMIELVPDDSLAEVGVPGEEITIVSVEHDYARGSEEAGEGTKLDVRFQALPKGVVFRPLRTTPKPRITNPLVATVVGPANEDIYTDAYGRVKIQLTWDRYQLKTETSSHWVPVMQENTGTSAAIPRIGWEVLVAFIDGDPDRPFVLGRVYNGKDPFPEALPAGKTKSALRSLSSPGRDGHNEIWMDDAAGTELMAVQAERDQNIVVARNKKEDVLHIEDNTIVKDETIEIGANNTVKVTKQQVLAVDGNQSITVGASRSRDVKGADQLTVAGSRSIKVGASHLRRVGGFDNVAETKSLSETTGGVELEASLKQNTTNASVLQTLTVGGAIVEVAGQGKEEKTEKLRVETIGAALITAVKTQFALKVGIARATQIGATLLAKAKTIKLASDEAKTMIKARATGKLHAEKTLKLEVGKTSVILSADGIVLNTTAEVSIEAAGKNDLLSKRADFE